MDEVVKLRLAFALKAARAERNEGDFWARAFSHASLLGGFEDSTLEELSRLRALGLPVSEAEAFEAFAGLAKTSTNLATLKRCPTEKP